jgi:enolase-phosphatase E1
VTVRLAASQTRALVLDIEGTTTPVDFVYRMLFPYARAHLAEYLARHAAFPECLGAVALLRAEYDAGHPSSAAQEFSPALILSYVNDLMDRDRKSPGLKALQGLVWQDGYASGELHGQVYSDVPPAFERWRARGLGIFIYSSGSVLAQRLLFGSVETGDLTPFISGYFDTGVGPKRTAASYAAISEHIRVPPPQSLFVSDTVEELDAAQSAGVRTALCIRGAGEARQPASLHPALSSFDELV